MPLTEPVIRTAKREGDIRVKRKSDGSLTIEQDWHFRIEADSLTRDRLEILYGTPGVPQFNVIYGGYGLVLDSAEGARLEEEPLFWDCVYHLSNTVEESKDRDPATGNQQTGNPTAWIPWVEASFEDYEEVLRKSLDIVEDQKHPDIDGPDPVGYNATLWLNSAGQPYESGFIRQKRLIKRQFTQFDLAAGAGSFTFDQMLSRNDLINGVEFLGKPKRTLRLVLDSLAIGTWYGVRCWRGDYSLIFKPDDWRLKQYDVGWYYLKDGVPPEEEVIPFIDKPTNGPYLGALNGKGKPAVNRHQPSIRYHKEFEDSDFEFLRVNM